MTSNLTKYTSTKDIGMSLRIDAIHCALAHKAHNTTSQCILSALDTTVSFFFGFLSFPRHSLRHDNDMCSLIASDRIVGAISLTDLRNIRDN